MVTQQSHTKWDAMQIGRAGLFLKKALKAFPVK
jgi:hypothetical protein